MAEYLLLTYRKDWSTVGSDSAQELLVMIRVAFVDHTKISEVNQTASPL